MTRRWEPLLHGADRDRALEIAAAIATEVTDVPTEWHGLMGTTGVAIFLAHAEAVGVGEDLGALDLLERGLGELADGSVHIGLWNGAAGVRWAISQLATGDDAASVIGHLDRAIQDRLAAASFDCYDIYAGLAGVLLAYADDGVLGDQILRRVLDYFERIDWLRLENQQFGIAHGVAGVLGALACCSLHGRVDDRVGPLMLAIVDALDSVDVADQRIGWCRGEIGIAIAMLGAARALGHHELADQAVTIALSPFARRGGRWPMDAGLCHGAAGLAHLYNRMYQATGDGRLGEYAHTWLRKTMAMQNPGHGIAGFAMLRSRPNPVWEADASLLVGSAGVGFALLSGVTSVVPSWDHVLCADICVPSTRPQAAILPPDEISQ